MNPRPNIYLIGAQKCGTTSLARELDGHESISFGKEKEPWVLTQNNYSKKTAQQMYAWLYSEIPGDGKRVRIRGDASTTYSMWPFHDDVPQRALEISGRDVRILYLVRNPHSRIVSAFNWMRMTGLEKTEKIGDALRRNPRYIDETRYWQQIDRWRRVFGESAIRLIGFEDYVAEREQVLTALLGWMGLDVSSAYREFLNASEPANVSRGSDTPSSVGLALISSRFWRERMRDYVPQALRRFVRGMYRSRRREFELCTGLTAEDAAYVDARLEEDRARLADSYGIAW